MRRLGALLAAAAMLGGCAPGWSPPKTTEGGMAVGADPVATRALLRARAAAEAAPGMAREAHEYARAFLACVQAACFPPQGQPTQADESRAVLAAIARAADQAAPDDKATLLADRGGVLLAGGQDAAAMQALSISVNIKPTMAAALPLLRLAGATNRRADVARTCQAVRGHVSSIEDRYELLDACFVNSHAAHVEAGLAWASREDREFYVRMRARRGKPVRGSAQLDGSRPPPTTIDRRSEADEDPAAKLARRRAMQQHGICQARCRSLHQSCGKRKASECAEDLNTCLGICDNQLGR